eukprot:scaffold10056_cov164-Amphora_coffeaeformis.AAC.10
MAQKELKQQPLVRFAPALPPVHVNSSWIGNQWIPPPGYRTYGPSDFLVYFSSTMNRQESSSPSSVLIVGDSTARRTYGTLYALLESAANTNATSHDVQVSSLDAAKVIDFGKQGSQHGGSCLPKSAEDEKHSQLICTRRIPSQGNIRHAKDDGSNRFDLYNLSCLEDLVTLVQDPSSILWRTNNNTLNGGRQPFYSLVIFVFGPWEVMGRIECGLEHGRLNSTLDAFRHLFRVENEHQQQRFVWRTWGTFGSTRNTPVEGQQGWTKARAHNALVKNLVDEHNAQYFADTGRPSSISYVDWGQAMRPRLYPQDTRIVGDIDPHYGLEARMAFNQMLLNHLIEQDRLQKYRIRPWRGVEGDVNARVLDGGDYVYNGNTTDSIVKNFLTITVPEPAVPPAAQEKYDRAVSLFCPACMWQVAHTCTHRVDFMIQKYKLPRYEALISVVENNPTCRKAS